MIKLGVLGIGGIAETVVTVLEGVSGISLYACASASNYSRAQDFKSKHHFKVAYKTYEELVKDPNIDLVYVANLISDHYETVKLCLNNNKNVICEKAFTFNAKQAKELCDLSKQKHLFLTEALLIKFTPYVKTLKGLINSGIIGKPYQISANLGYKIFDRKRIYTPSMGGGILLDVAVYPINFAFNICGTNYKKIDTHCTFTKSGVDESDFINLTYDNNLSVDIFATMNGQTDRYGYIYGSDGYIEVKNINSPEEINVYTIKPGYHNVALIKTIKIKDPYDRYAYEFLSSIKAIENNLIETPEYTHKEIVKNMEFYDELRKKWGFNYPNESEKK